MSLKDLAQDDMDNVVLNTDDFAEAIELIDQHGGETETTGIVEWGQTDYGLKKRARVMVSHTDLTAPSRKHRVRATAPDGEEVTLGISNWHHVEGGLMLVCAALADRKITGQGAETSRL